MKREPICEECNYEYRQDFPDIQLEYAEKEK
jgi:hypothetical protein